MAKRSKFDGIVVKRDVDDQGFIHAYDKNDRACWGGDDPERVILMHDLRKYAAGLHIGQLGWTVPGTTDSYKWIDIVFDNGVQLPILVYGIERVVPEQAAAIAADVIKKNRNTRFDADPGVAENCYRVWIKKEYDQWVATDQLVELGTGHDELYAFTFPSLQELAHLKGAAHYPVKIGYTGNQDAGAIQRIRGQIIEAAAFPERPTLLLVYRTWNGRAMEQLAHAEFRRRDRRITTTPGIEWYMTNERELVDLCAQVGPGVPHASPKPIAGASPDLADLVDAGARAEASALADSACVSIRITQPESDP